VSKGLKSSQQMMKKNPYPQLLPDFNIHVFYYPLLLSEDQKDLFCDLITTNSIVYNAATFQHDSATFDTKHGIVAVKPLGRSCSGLFK
jgi:hypothetical protein